MNIVSFSLATFPIYIALIIHTFMSICRALSSNAVSSSKKITFVRHGVTHMNEYLGNHKAFGTPGFTDCFDDQLLPLYKDTPLSEWGQREACRLLAQTRPTWADQVELVCISPLTRALQTFDIGLKHHIPPSVPIVAQPLAAERLYLISDVGRGRRELQQNFGYVNFDQLPQDTWWYTPNDRYQEWRPTGKGQRYACPGEPQPHFDSRMSKFYHWLGEQTHRHICVVCHHGVIDWMLDEDFDNCQYTTVEYDAVTPSRLIDLVSQ